MTFNLIREPSQWASILLIIISMFIMVRWARRHVTRWLWAVPVGVWLIHGLLFYLYVQLSLLFPTLPRGFFTEWASVRTLHGYATVLQILYTLNKLNGKVDHNGRG